MDLEFSMMEISGNDPLAGEETLISYNKNRSTGAFDYLIGFILHHQFSVEENRQKGI